MEEKIRLNKYLASLGVGSRRKVNDFIKQGRIKVNGEVAQLNHRIDPKADQILVDEKEITRQQQFVYILLNKPKNVISTTSDEFGRKSVVDLVKVNARIYPVGRLDASTTGLLILTNDGDLTYRLTHPKFNISKTYQLVVTGKVDDGVLDKLKKGSYLKDNVTSGSEVNIVHREGNRVILELTIHQGWNHQIQRMCAILGLNLINLKRIAIGEIEIDSLKEGEYKQLSLEEIKSLLK